MEEQDNVKLTLELSSSSSSSKWVEIWRFFPNSTGPRKSLLLLAPTSPRPLATPTTPLPLSPCKGLREWAVLVWGCVMLKGVLWEVLVARGAVVDNGGACVEGGMPLTPGT